MRCGHRCVGKDVLIKFSIQNLILIGTCIPKSLKLAFKIVFVTNHLNLYVCYEFRKVILWVKKTVLDISI